MFRWPLGIYAVVMGIWSTTLALAASLFFPDAVQVAAFLTTALVLTVVSGLAWKGEEEDDHHS